MIAQFLINLESLESLGPGHPLLVLLLELVVIDGLLFRKPLEFLFEGQLPQEEVELLPAFQIGRASEGPDQSPQEDSLDNGLQVFELFHCHLLYLCFLVVLQVAVKNAHQRLHEVPVAAGHQLLAVQPHKLQGWANQFSEETFH